MIRRTAFFLAVTLSVSAASADQATEKRAVAKQARLSLRQAERDFGPEDLRTADALDRLGQAYLSLAKPALARPLLERVLAIRRKLLGPGHGMVAETLIVLARIYFLDRRAEEAARAAEEALSIQEVPSSSSPAKPAIIAKTLVLLAEIYVSGGFPEKAEPLARRAAEVYQETEGPKAPVTAETLVLLAKIRVELGKKETATPPAPVRSIEPWVSSSPSPSEQTGEDAGYSPGPGTSAPADDRWLNIAHSLRNQAEAYKKLGRRAQAARLLHEALEVYEKVFRTSPEGKGQLPPEERWLAVARELRAQAKSNAGLGRSGQAERLFQETLNIYDKIFGPKYPEGEAVRKEYSEFSTRVSK